MIWLIGAGTMSQDYAKILKATNSEFKVIGRSVNRANAYAKKMNVEVETGGVENFIQSNPELPQAVIVAVEVENLSNILECLLNFGVKRILVEKPSGINADEIEKTSQLCKKVNSTILVAYNRRFFSSVEAAKKIIDNDGGVSSFFFEFSEWSHVIEKLEIAKPTLDSWLLANSSHVIDLAFHLGGFPKEIVSFSAGKGGLPWHPEASKFSGAGRSSPDVLFSYQANWIAPGRWSVEVLTEAHRIYLKPMEKLAIQKVGSVAIENVEVDDSFDLKFKPGLYKQVVSFLDQKDENFTNIHSQAKHAKIYDQILKGVQLS